MGIYNPIFDDIEEEHQSDEELTSGAVYMDTQYAVQVSSGFAYKKPQSIESFELKRKNGEYFNKRAERLYGSGDRFYTHKKAPTQHNPITVSRHLNGSESLGYIKRTKVDANNDRNQSQFSELKRKNGEEFNQRMSKLYNLKNTNFRDGFFHKKGDQITRYRY